MFRNIATEYSGGVHTRLTLGEDVKRLFAVGAFNLTAVEGRPPKLSRPCHFTHYDYTPKITHTGTTVTHSKTRHEYSRPETGVHPAGSAKLEEQTGIHLLMECSEVARKTWECSTLSGIGK